MGILLETSPQRMNLLKGGDIDNSTIANNPQNANDQIACKFLRRQTIGRNTLYEGNVRSQEKSHPGDLNGAPRGQSERRLGDFSSENIAQEVQNVNDENDHTTTRKSTGRGLDGSAISADALDQSIDNSSIPNNPQDINDQQTKSVL